MPFQIRTQIEKSPEMRNHLKPLFIFTALAALLISPFLISGRDNKATVGASDLELVLIRPADIRVEKKMKTRTELMAEEAAMVYSSMKLNKAGLSKKAFDYAWKGYKNLLQKGKLRNPGILSICDFSQSSRKKRLYIVDLTEQKLLVNTYVAHGRQSGAEYAKSFSNVPESNKSSLGFYVTRNTYYGQDGLALKIDGVEKGINDKANARNIVIHGSDYVGEAFIKRNPFNGRSFGCPAIPEKHTKKIIQTIKNGTCLFIYHPTKNYLVNSRILNG